MIYYGVCGEGLAHSMRALLLARELNKPVTFYTYGDGYDFLKQSEYPVIKIEGMEFKTNGDKINNFQTIKAGLKFLWNMKPEMSGNPDLCISDWEPTICKFARKKNIPLVSTASQHKFKFWNTERLLFQHKIYSKMAGLFCNYFPADKYIIPTYQHTFIPEGDNVYPMDVFINPQLKNESEKYTLIYARPNKLRENLCKMYPDAVVFGQVKNMNFHYYLANAKIVHSTAGPQLIGECLFLNKKLRTYPIPGQTEQVINHLDYVVNRPPNSFQRYNGLYEAVRIVNEMC